MRQVKNPETIGQHIFRVALMNWFLAERVKPRLNLEKVIKLSLAHDLCEVYAGDATPYRGLISNEPRERRETLKRWRRLSLKEKQGRAQKKFEREKKALEKLTKKLDPSIRREIEGLWLDYEDLLSREGRFVKQGDKAETLLQALEYFFPKDKAMAVAWWEDAEDLIDHPVIRDFLGEVEKKFYQGREPESLLAFLLEVGQLKQLPRRGWVARRIKTPETIADHSFLVALMVWVLGQGKKINMERALKMALIHEICSVYAGDATPHDIFDRRLLWWRRWGERPRLPRGEKEKRFLKIYEKETKALCELIEKLPSKLRQEILELWGDFVERKSKEADFVDQVNCLATFLQALEYWKQAKTFPIRIFAEHTLEFVEDPKLVEFLKVMKRRFRPKHL